MIARRKGNWIDDLAWAAKAFLLFGLASMVIIPILVVVIVFLVVHG